MIRFLMLLALALLSLQWGLADDKPRPGLVVPKRCWNWVMIVTDKKGNPKCEDVNAVNRNGIRGRQAVRGMAPITPGLQQRMDIVDIVIPGPAVVAVPDRRKCEVVINFSCTEYAAVVGSNTFGEDRPIIFEEPDAETLPVNRPLLQKAPLWLMPPMVEPSQPS